MFLDAAVVSWLLLDARRHAVTESASSTLPSTPLAACAFHTATGCTLSMPTTLIDCLEKFCSNLLKFHSNFHWIPVQIFRIFRISSNLVVTEFFLELNPKTLGGRSIVQLFAGVDFLVGKMGNGDFRPPRAIFFFYDANLPRTIHQSTTGKR
jgi:hypothetical protein